MQRETKMFAKEDVEDEFKSTPSMQRETLQQHTGQKRNRET